MVHYLLAWIPMVAIAVANGGFREAWLVPVLYRLYRRKAGVR